MNYSALKVIEIHVGKKVCYNNVYRQWKLGRFEFWCNSNEAFILCFYKTQLFIDDSL